MAIASRQLRQATRIGRLSGCRPHLTTAQNPNDDHFNAKGYDLLGVQVARSVRASLKKAPP